MRSPRVGLIVIAHFIALCLIPLALAIFYSERVVLASATDTELVIADVVCVLAGTSNLFCFVYVYRLLRVRNEGKGIQLAWALTVLAYSFVLVTAAFNYWSEERGYVTELDNDTDLLEVYTSGNDLIYKLKLVNWDSSGLDMRKFELVMTNRAAAAHCGKEKYDKMMKKGGRIIFNYIDRTSQPTTDIVVDKVVCDELSRHGFVIFQSGR